MAKKYISQADLAAFCGCEQPYISQLKREGVFDDVLDTNGKFLRSKSTEYAKIYEDRKDLTREPQREANQKKRNTDEISQGKNEAVNSSNLLQSFGMFDVSYLGAESQVELTTLIEEGGKKSAVQKIQIKDAFIESKKKENEFKKELGVLIELEEAEAVMELILSNMKTKMYNAPHLFKAKFPKITKEQVEYLYMLIDEAFSEFNKYGLDEKSDTD